MQDKISITFFENSVSYYNAASVLCSCEQRSVDDQLFLTPIIYLYRHSIELIIKALIISYLEQSLNQNSIEEFYLYSENGKETKLKLTSCHSLNALYSFLNTLIRQKE